MSKKVYIAGPMTGYENYNRDAFNIAAGRMLVKRLNKDTPLFNTMINYHCINASGL